MSKDQRSQATVIDRRGLVGFSAGLAGFGIGLGAVVLDVVILGLVAGVCSFISALTIVRAPGKPASSGRREGDFTLTDGQPVGVAPARSETQRDQTPLLPADYFEIAARSRVVAARRFLKPLAVIRLSITGDDGGGLTGDDDVANVFATTLRECDTACILSDSEIGLVLEDTPENGAIWVVERLRRALPENLECRLRAGVACYPAHAMEANELLGQVDLALERASEWTQDRIEVARAD